MMLACTVQLQTAQALFQVGRICKVEVLADADDEYARQLVLLYGRIFADWPPTVCAADAALVGDARVSDGVGNQREWCLRGSTDVRGRNDGSLVRGRRQLRR